MCPLEPAIVDITEAFVETVPQDRIKNRLRESLGANFGVDS